MPVVETHNWAKSALGQDIALFKSNENPEHPILLIGGVHGDEPEGVQLANDSLQWLKSNTTHKLAPWIVIPCLNPDGFKKNERTNGNGVDLNRNYPSRDWSPAASKPRYSPGPSPSSEPEIKALVALIQQSKPRLIIHCHSWNPCVVYTGEPGRPDATALGDSSGYEVRDDIGYPTTGSLSQYGWHDNKIPIICIEEAEHAPLKDVWLHFGSGIQKIFSNLSLRNVRER
ncbi:MAG: DUF2817 domain-containing protein [Bdellovibrionales bacterium]|nr:DUF2817 domain-containing protein [Bdellovibrionales bacterium]